MQQQRVHATAVRSQRLQARLLVGLRAPHLDGAVGRRRVEARARAVEHERPDGRLVADVGGELAVAVEVPDFGAAVVAAAEEDVVVAHGEGSDARALAQGVLAGEIAVGP